VAAAILRSVWADILSNRNAGFPEISAGRIGSASMGSQRRAMISESDVAPPAPATRRRLALLDAGYLIWYYNGYQVKYRKELSDEHGAG
jgi:hypothetical protein